jgi:hypothetical protein
VTAKVYGREKDKAFITYQYKQDARKQPNHCGYISGCLLFNNKIKEVAKDAVLVLSFKG